MTYEEKKKFLSQYADYVLIAKEAKQHILELREMQLPASPNLDGMPKNPNHEDKMARYAARFDALYTDWENAMEKIYAVHRAINALENKAEQYVLAAYYIDGKRMWEIAEEKHCSDRKIRNIKRSGIMHIELR